MYSRLSVHIGTYRDISVHIGTYRDISVHIGTYRYISTILQGVTSTISQTFIQKFRVSLTGRSDIMNG